MYLIGAAMVAAISFAGYKYITNLNSTIEQLKINNSTLATEVTELTAEVEGERNQREREIRAIQESVRVYIETQNKNKENMDKLKKLFDENKKQNEDFKEAFDYILPADVVDELFNFH